jgi:hypothetical protein
MYWVRRNRLQVEPDPIRPEDYEQVVTLSDHEAALAALREECATECREDTAALRRDRDMLWGQVFERDKIIDGLRTAQPSGINVPGLGRLTESPEGEWTDE